MRNSEIHFKRGRVIFFYDSAQFNSNKILEIGCNDGVFLENFDKKKTLGIEPCKNIAKLSKKKQLREVNRIQK